MNMPYWYHIILVWLLSGSNPCWGGLVKVARISLGLSSELCRQYSEYNVNKVMSHSPRKDSALGPRKDSAVEVRWTRCDHPGECLPFTLHAFSGPPGGDYDRIVRHPVTEYTYPGLVTMEKLPWLTDRFLLQGHGVLLDNVTMLTSASILFDGPIYHTEFYARFKMGGSDRKITKSGASWCYQETYPKWDRINNAHNFGIVHFTKAILLTDVIKPMKFAQPGQKIKGPCRYASWTKYTVSKGLHIHLYSSDLMEASVRILPDDVCQKAGFPKTHICTPPLLCGLQDSGAPLICSDNNVDYIYALSSHYMQDYQEPKFCGGHSFSSFSKITELDWAWVEGAKEGATKNKLCVR